MSALVHKFYVEYVLPEQLQLRSHNLRLYITLQNIISESVDDRVHVVGIIIGLSGCCFRDY